VRGRESQRENGWVVFGGAPAIGHFDDGAHGALGVERAAFEHAGSVLARELALGCVVRATFSAEDQEAFEPLPAVDGEGEAAGRVRNLARVGLFGLRCFGRIEVLGVVRHRVTFGWVAQHVTSCHVAQVGLW